MADDWLLDKIAAVEHAAATARAALGQATEVLAPSADERKQGVSLITIARSMNERGAGPRRAVSVALRDYERAVADLRRGVVRALIDEEGVTFTDLATAMGISRQALTRLYRAADSCNRGGEAD